MTRTATRSVRRLRQSRPSSGSSAISLKGSGWETDEYNGFNQLITGTKDGVRTDYKYKPDGLRQSKTTNGVMTTHVWDGSNIALDIVGSSVVKYVRGINLIYMDAAGAVSYYSYNAHGDVVGLTDASGAVIKSYRYDAFGVEAGARLRATQTYSGIAVSIGTQRRGHIICGRDIIIR